MEPDAEFFEFSEPMPCYEFNGGLEPAEDNGRCEHCRKFLTLECEYIDHFMEEDE
uniref:Uncharacterized protein n=1 Tax=uncultured euryarchaeote Rifle_16ft_4_minimus_37664 TaxID=1665194 RepID=A0A0H4T866_9EURY|nr:hypothetical protein [uncultured euryarchaeote Rifle_16ft_4_minimus_37664]